MRADLRRLGCVVTTAILGVLLMALATAPRRPWLLYNRTPSVPLGFYVRCGDQPRRGDLVAFPLPAAAHGYARRREERVDVLLLKPVLAIGGDHVSTLRGELRVNRTLVAAIPDADAAGRALPRCHLDRVLADGELFVGSAAHPHSFDSRFFGPVHAARIVGVYRRVTLGVSRHDASAPPR